MLLTTRQTEGSKNKKEKDGDERIMAASRDVHWRGGQASYKALDTQFFAPLSELQNWCQIEFANTFKEDFRHCFVPKKQ